jgi:hypothetical protein
MNGLRELLNGCRRGVAALLLFVIAIHAASPLGQPFERHAGSAFSASTADVSLAADQRIGAVERAVVAMPAVVLPGPSIVPLIAVLVIDRRPLRAGPSATGPPPEDTTFAPLSPRAPPAA